MKSPIIKLLIIVSLFVSFTAVFSSKAYATAPIVTGSVLVKGTNAPVVGVWVKWTDSTKHIRYAQTNDHGVYSFASWQAMSQSERDAQVHTMVDTNLDGIKDAPLADTGDSSSFGCVQSPHEFTAVVPKGKNYSFQGVTYSFNNIGVTTSPPSIFENPPPAACGVSCAVPADCQAAKDGCTACISGVCKTPVPACGVSCTKPTDCAASKDGCTTCTGGVCKTPACGVSCSTPADCQSSKDGCTTCVSGVCKTPPPACGVSCTKPTDCAASKDGCTACTGGVCKTPACGVSCSTPADCQSSKDGCTTCVNGACKAPPPACGVACTKPTDCAASKDGCTACTGGVCKTPVPACGISCTKPTDCQSAKDGCTTCTGGVCAAPVPACGVACTKPTDCQNAKDGCTSCTGGVCSAPVPACGVSCKTPADCQSVKDGCTSCTGGICAAPPQTPTPVPACGIACTTPADCQNVKDGCTACTGGVCKAPAPVFNPAACTCDGITNTGLFSGQNATITAFAKVSGADVTSAKVVDQKFFLAEGAETIATIIASSNPIPASVISSSPSLVRYQSQWNLQLPQLKSGATYRLWSQLNCQPTTSAYNYSSLSHKVVLGTQTQSASLLDNIVNWLKSFLTPSNTSTLKGKDTLQLGTVTPANVYQKTCTFIKFKVGN